VIVFVIKPHKTCGGSKACPESVEGSRVQWFDLAHHERDNLHELLGAGELPRFENSRNVEVKPQANNMTLTRHRESPCPTYPKNC
jgi:hypothetical protein